MRPPRRMTADPRRPGRPAVGRVPDPGPARRAIPPALPDPVDFCPSRAGSARRWRPPRAALRSGPRRAALLVGGGVAAAAGIAAYPYLATARRAGARLAAAQRLDDGLGDRRPAAAARRAPSGTTCVVAPLVRALAPRPRRSPTHVPAVLWAGGLAVAAALLCYAFVGLRSRSRCSSAGCARGRRSTSVRAAPACVGRCRGWSCPLSRGTAHLAGRDVRSLVVAAIGARAGRRGRRALARALAPTAEPGSRDLRPASGGRGSMAGCGTAHHHRLARRILLAR